MHRLQQYIDELNVHASKCDGSITGSRIINMHRLQQYIDELNVHASKCDGSITGSRIINMHRLQQYIDELNVHASKCDGSITGSRIINMHRLQQYIDELNVLASKCDGSVVLKGEVREGLASIISTRCSTCSHTITLMTSDKVKGPRGYSSWECNLAAMWGQMMTGGGHSQLKETMSVLGVPVMTKSTFIQSERSTGEWWRKELEQLMLEAGREEKQLAEERGDYHDGSGNNSDCRWGLEQKVSQTQLQCQIWSSNNHWKGNEKASSHWSAQ